MKGDTPKKIFVGVSGGVDSSVTAALLKEQGHDVVGVFIRTWQPDWTPCTWKDERRDAMRVCAHLDIPFIELDLEDAYKKGVADYMIEEYKQGRTPNPDVMCNREVKFGAFLTWALEKGADYVATGHYAQAVHENTMTYLKQGIDGSKDQSYFLWTLTQDQLKHILFPLGGFTKKEVRKRAEKYHLPTSQKKDSQGICFIGHIDMKEFLSHYIEEHPGKVVTQDGTVIGTHDGVIFFTLGQRHGFTISPEHKGTEDTPYYVVGKNIEKNELIVAHALTLKENHATYELTDVVDNQKIFKQGDTYEAHIRYHGSPLPITITSYNEKDHTMTIAFTTETPLVAPGQSLVIYNNGYCLGGGVVY